MRTHYDTIVVGAGSAGATMAARLTEDSDRRVLLLEAGPDYSSVDQIPNDLANGFEPSLEAHDWHLKATVVPGREVPYPRGKVTGGTSAVNSIIAIRGTPEDYNEWAALGNDRWSWAGCLPYFRKLEDDRDFDSEFHGEGGPIPVVRWHDEELIPLQSAWREACRTAGYPDCDDFNLPRAMGVGSWPMNREGRFRVSTAVGYLNPARERPNLVIQGDSPVLRVLFEGDRAVGVEVESNNGVERFRADEIVLATGTVHSPTVLLHSGVGPAAHLEEIGVTVVHDLPGVGEHLVDHAGVPIICIPRTGVGSDEDPYIQIGLRYTASGSEEQSDMQAYCIRVGRTHPVVQGIGEDADSAAILFAALMKPKSTGRIRLRSTDPSKPPHIDLNLVSHEDDVARLVDGMKRLWELATSEPMDEVLLGIARPESNTMENDEDIRSYLYETVSHHVHPVGTCRMGPSNDPMAVVDQEGRVHGLEGLRIADASIMPTIPRANTNLTAIMIGEKIADMMRGNSRAPSPHT